jgi:hypothetical protein
MMQPPGADLLALLGLDHFIIRSLHATYIMQGCSTILVPRQLLPLR